MGSSTLEFRDWEATTQDLSAPLVETSVADTATVRVIPESNTERLVGRVSWQQQSNTIKI